MESKVIFVLVMVFSLALSTLAQHQTETCAVDPGHRQNCGFPGVTPSQCADKGCCFDSTVPGVPWCFHPMAVDNLPEDECSF
ncbi:PREDICTED: trefoil factor 1 [Hipposideros armiger]|uniref:Trefoil factor 1 n=1 Tax=Hipposideros armiger TaxID=186990 RepID=A0A8B7TA62_HIPAR|nr:PREDICTED: trefoil factor 1 [Hipposideros armiger]